MQEKLTVAVDDQYNQKQAAHYSQDMIGMAPAAGNCAGALYGTAAGRRAVTLAEDAAREMKLHAELLAKRSAAHAFLTQHPEFDEFVRLVRSGSIQF